MKQMMKPNLLDGHVVKVVSPFLRYDLYASSTLFALIMLIMQILRFYVHRTVCPVTNCTIVHYE